MGRTKHVTLELVSLSTSVRWTYEDEENEGKTGHERGCRYACVCTCVSESVGKKLKPELVLRLAGNRGNWTGPEGGRKG